MADNKPQLPPESHYDPNKLGGIFAIAAVVLLFALLGIFAKDYSRQWKDYQRQFRALEIEKTRVKLDEQQVDLTNKAEYQDLVKSVNQAQAKVNAQSAAINTLKHQVASIDAVKRLHTKYSQNYKAQRDALKYRYEVVTAKEGKDGSKLKAELDELEAKISDYRVKLENDDKQLADKNAQLKAIEKDYKDLDKKRAAISKKQDILMKKLKRIDQAEMSGTNQFAEMVRDLPLIDLANPNYKIKQIVLKDIPEDVNFMKVPRVDRCTTCHLGIDNPDYKQAPQPFTTHPNLEMFMDKNSPHPLDEFACTTCHMGRGRGTDFSSAAHTPRNEEQQKEWEKKYHWQEMHHWDQPMLPVQFTEAACFKCHQDQEVVKGAEKLNLGLALIERAGCYNCHTITKYKDWPKTGPSLEFVGSKINKSWAYHWIENPKSIRHDAWMPAYFNQSNNNSPEAVRRNQQEIHSIVSFLFANSKPYEVSPVAAQGDAKNGKELVSSIGCFGCHEIEPKPTKDEMNRDKLHRQFGPNLIGLGSKTSKEWLVQWLKNPKHYNADTRMPNMRLNDQEAADIAEYLIQDKSPVADKPVPPVDERVLNGIVLDFLKKNNSLEQAQVQMNSMDQDAKLKFAGQRLIREYGCFSCHKIPGFENEKPIGTDLSEEGTKSIERLDFGFLPIEHSKSAWIHQKLMDPRAFDHGKVLQPLERLKMPNFKLTDDEADAIETAVLGFVKDRPNPAKMPNQGLKATMVNQGRVTIRQFNCQGCHIIEGEGGSIQPTIVDWLVNSQGKDANDAKAVVRSFSPPNLIGEGAKIQAQWLFDFIHEPITIRPWLKVRMPTYGFNASKINSIVKYFNYLDDQEFPFTDIYHPSFTKEEFAAAEKLFSKDVFGCAQCHIVGDKLPEGSPDSWAPNFALAAKRLKPDWIIKWLTNPADLLPGTKMPTYFDPKNFDDSGPPDILNGDEHAQIKALRDYLLTIASQPQAKKAEPQQAPVAEKGDKAAPQKAVSSPATTK